MRYDFWDNYQQSLEITIGFLGWMLGFWPLIILSILIVLGLILFAPKNGGL